MLKTASNLYESSLAEAGASFSIPSDLIGDITLEITQADSQNEYVLLPHPSLLYILEFQNLQSRRPTGPYICMYGMAGNINPQTLLTLLDDKPLLCPFSHEEGYTNNLYFYDRNPSRK